jgi:hypothetical protein
MRNLFWGCTQWIGRSPESEDRERREREESERLKIEKANLEDLPRRLAEMDEAMRREATERARIDSMNFEQLADIVWFGSRGLTLDQMRAEMAQWEFNFNLREFLNTWPRPTDHIRRLVCDQLAEYLRTDDDLRLYAVHKLLATIRMGE